MKNTTTAIVLILLSIVSFSRVIAKINNADKANTEQVADNKDVDVAAILKSMNIATSVDAAALEAKYPGVKLNEESVDFLQMTFHNPNNAAYTLYVYDVDGHIVDNQINLDGTEATVQRNGLPKGMYTYQLKGENNIYCGKFLFK